MEIKNFKWVSPTGTKYTLDGIVELYPGSGFNFTKLTRINGLEEDSLTIKQLIKHEDILQHIKQNNNVLC